MHLATYVRCIVYFTVIYKFNKVSNTRDTYAKRNYCEKRCSENVFFSKYAVMLSIKVRILPHTEVITHVTTGIQQNNTVRFYMWHV